MRRRKPKIRDAGPPRSDRCVINGPEVEVFGEGAHPGKAGSRPPPFSRTGCAGLRYRQATEHSAREVGRYGGWEGGRYEAREGDRSRSKLFCMLYKNHRWVHREDEKVALAFKFQRSPKLGAAKKKPLSLGLCACVQGEQTRHNWNAYRQQRE